MAKKRASNSNHSEPPSHVEALTPGQLRELLVLGQRLWEAKPWEHLGWGELLRVDLPALGLKGLCVEVLGHGDEELDDLEEPGSEEPIYGLALYRHPLEREAFFEALGSFHEGQDLGDELPESLLLSLVRPEALFDEHRRALEAWGEALPEPRVAQLELFFADHSVAPLPAELASVVLAAARLVLDLVEGTAPGALAATAVDAPLRRELSLDLPLHPEQRAALGPGVRLRAHAVLPYEAGPDLPLALDLGSEALALRGRAEESPAERDARLAGAILTLAQRRFPEALEALCNELFSDLEREAFLARSALAYQGELEGQRLVDLFIDFADLDAEVDPEVGAAVGALVEADWRFLAAQRDAYLSVWEVIEVQEGVSMTLRDRLGGEERRIDDVLAADPSMKGLQVLARVVDLESGPLLSGTHCSPLEEEDIQGLLSWALESVDRKRRAAPRLLRPFSVARGLLARWDALVFGGEEELRLVDADGDEILLTVDHYAFDAGQREAIISAVLGIQGVELSAEGEGNQDVFVFLRHDPEDELGPLLLGRLLLGADRARLETDTLRHADDLRERLESACEDLLRHRIREHEDPASELR